MNQVTTLDIAEAAFFLKRGLTLTGLELRAAKSFPHQSVVELLFTGEKAGDMALQFQLSGAMVLPGDLERLSIPLALCLANAHRGGRS